MLRLSAFVSYSRANFTVLRSYTLLLSDNFKDNIKNFKDNIKN
jgi:hypothetical protein